MPQPTPASYLALRLLISATRKLAKDPLLTHRFRDAFINGLNDTSAGSTSSDAFRTLGSNLSSFCDKAGFNGLERLVLALEMVRVLVVPANAIAALSANGNSSANVSPAVRNALALHARSKETGLAAIQLLKDCWSVGIEGLAAGQGGETVGPVALSRLLGHVASDWRIDYEAGEAGIWDEDRGEALLPMEAKREMVRAIRNRLGRELATQVVIHSFESSMECVSALASQFML